MDEAGLRSEICTWGKSFFARGMTAGSSGNISVRLADGFLITPTNSCLGRLYEDRLSRLDGEGNWVSGEKPSKEFLLHHAFYSSNQSYNAVVHLHSTYATLLSCIHSASDKDVIRPLTPYPIMRLGTVPFLPYSKPGSDAIVTHIQAIANKANAVIIANHGPVVAGSDLESAVYAAEELEQAAKLQILGDGFELRMLNSTQQSELLRTLRLK